MKGPKTLYVSDLDGTLLLHDQIVSPLTEKTVTKRPNTPGLKAVLQ